MKVVDHKELPADVKAQLKEKRLRVNSYRYYSSKQFIYVVPKTIQMGLSKAIAHIKKHSVCELQILNTEN
jgi:hypothetical protein